MDEASINDEELGCVNSEFIGQRTHQVRTPLNKSNGLFISLKKKLEKYFWKT